MVFLINAFFLIIILPSTIYRYYKFKEINFDSHYLYFDEKKILIRNVKEIGNGYIIYINNNKEFKVYYNYSFFNKNLEKLREVHKAQSTIS